VPPFVRGDTFGGARSSARWWITAEKDSAKALVRMIKYNEPYVYRLSSEKSNGYALRCIKD